MWGRLSIIVILRGHNIDIMVEPILSMFHYGVKNYLKFSILAEDKKPVKSEREIMFENR